MKKIISFLLALIIVSTALPAFKADNDNSIDLKDVILILRQ